MAGNRPLVLCYGPPASFSYRLCVFGGTAVEIEV
jgi:hypothetical protein